MERKKKKAWKLLAAAWGYLIISFLQLRSYLLNCRLYRGSCFLSEYWDYIPEPLGIPILIAAFSPPANQSSINQEVIRILLPPFTRPSAFCLLNFLLLCLATGMWQVFYCQPNFILLSYGKKDHFETFHFLLMFHIRIFYSDYQGLPWAMGFSQCFWLKLTESYNNIWTPGTQWTEVNVSSPGSISAFLNYKSALFSVPGTIFRNLSHVGQ